MKKLFLIGLLFISSNLFAQKFALVNGTIHTITNGIIDNGLLLIDGNNISFVGKKKEFSTEYKVVDCAGLQIYPGLIDAGSTLGTAEIGSIPETNDFSELGEFATNMHTLTAVNPNSEIIPTIRVEGITTALSEPVGSLFNGMSTLINLHGYTPEQMAVKKITGLHLTFPTKGRFSSFDKNSLKQREKRFEDQMKKLNELWEIAENYSRNFKSAASSNSLNEFKRDIRFDPFIDLFEKKYPLIINVNRDVDILRAIEWVKNKNVEVIFSGVSEGWRVADYLKEANIPCLVGPVLNLPTRSEDRYDRQYVNATILHNAGVKAALRSGSDTDSRNLPFHAATLVAYGLSEDAALKMLTQFPAEIFKVDNLLGSLSEGKLANIVVCNGNILEVSTKIHKVFINGFDVSLESRQTKLYDEFRKRKP